VLQYFAKFGEAGLPDLNGDLSFHLVECPRAQTLSVTANLTGGAALFFIRGKMAVLVFQQYTAGPLLSHSSVSSELDEGFHRRFSAWLPLLRSKHIGFIAIFVAFPRGHVLEFFRKKRLVCPAHRPICRSKMS